jgi:hypothetical protein
MIRVKIVSSDAHDRWETIRTWYYNKIGQIYEVEYDTVTFTQPIYKVIGEDKWIYVDDCIEVDTIHIKPFDLDLVKVVDGDMTYYIQRRLLQDSRSGSKLQLMMLSQYAVNTLTNQLINSRDNVEYLIDEIGIQK